MDKEFELYQEELRSELINLNKSVKELQELTQKQLETYVAPKDEIEVKGEVIVNTEKEVAVTNLEAIKDYLGEFSDKITTAIEKNAPERLESLTIENITDAKADVVKISNLDELQSEFERITKAINDLPAPVVNVAKQEIVFPKSPSQAIPVRLSDGKSFYNAITTALANGMASFIDVNNKGVPARLTAKGSVPVNVDNAPQADVFNQMIIGTRNNQLEIDFSGVDPDDITLLTVTKTNGGDATNGGGQATFSTGVNTSGEIKAITTRTVTYHPHSENYAAFTAIFTQGIPNSFQRIGLYSDTNGFFVGYEGVNFGITKRSNSTDVFVNRNAFNVDTLNAQSGSKYTRNGIPETMNPHFDNLYRIRYGWLGAAPIYFEILSPDGEWVLFHIIKHPNTVAVPTIEEPNQPLRVHIKKTTAGATNLTVKTACWAAGTSSDLAKITSILYDDTLAKTVRSVITGQTTGGGGGYVNVKVNPSGALVTDSTISGTVAVSSPTYKTRIDETSTPSVTYVGKAAIGSSEASAVWQISKIDESGSETVITWSGSGFTAIWNNRTSLSYS